MFLVFTIAVITPLLIRFVFFFFSSRRRHTRSTRDRSSDVCSSDLPGNAPVVEAAAINGAGVTATLRAAVARIIENLKSNVDTTLYEAPAAPPTFTPNVGRASARQIGRASCRERV